MKSLIYDPLLASAGIALKPIRLPDEDERFNALQKELSYSPWLEEVEQREYLLAMLTHITVSDTVRKQCERDMFEAGRRGWRT